MSTTVSQTSTTESPKSLELSTEAQTLRAELKGWETSFAAANSGRKAGREDIKQHPEIAQKYKAYNKLRTRLSSTLPTQCSSSPPPPAKKRKRPSSSEARPSPSSSQQHTQKLSPIRTHPAALDPYDPPSHLTPNPPRTIIGPTPQKNGLVLGLFDLLSPKRTPSKRDPASASHLADLQPLATPSKNRSRLPPATNPSQHTHPTSATTSLLTPTARRFLQRTPTASRTSAPLPAPDDTPEFLRRSAPLFPSRTASTSTAQALDGADAPLSWSPVAVRVPRKPVGRSLSTLVRGLRAMEEEALDEELELLREVEGGDAVRAPGTGTDGDAGGGKAGGKDAKVLVRDSQAGEMPLGPDGEGDFSSEEEGDGRPLRKTWKKKGQKRSTRRVVMRPTVGKWQPEREWGGGGEAEKEEGEGVVRETQQVGDGAVPVSGQEALDEEQAEENDDGKKGEEISVEKKAKPARKVSATAHANFRTLKIRNKQSKGKKGGRFGRR
ncbi:DNA replication regulator sld2 [Xylographa trunciseda]|nr:DNA replication regulator sld2 [Xylographa trunciseda]